jgi:hypothetical protein
MIRRLACALALLAAGCDDRQLVEQKLLVAASPAPQSTSSIPGLEISLVRFSAENLLGAEEFEITVRVERYWGQVLTRYHLKTPYETTVHDVKPLLPVPLLYGVAIIRNVALTEVPQAGPYRVEFWVDTEDGLPSNHVVGKLNVQ